MNIVTALMLLCGGLIILWKCAELLVSGSVELAKRLGISPLIIGLTIVAMGTSAPEVATSISAVFRETGGGTLALGNVFGSNIANLALIGGLVALLSPIRIRKQTLRREIPIMLGVALLLWPLLGDLALSRIEGALLLVVFVVLILLTVYAARKEAKSESESVELITEEVVKIEKERPLKINILFVIAGLIGLVVGAKMSVAGAVFIGQKIGLSEAVIGLSILAIGTSLPELVTCLVAASKGHHDISIGNLVGSNIFNTLLVTGVAGVARPFEIVQRLKTTDYWIMIAITASFAILGIAGRKKITRTGGVLLLCSYIAYMAYLFIRT